MNLDKLRQAEADFLQRYPGGFADPGLETVRKRHNIGKLSDFARSNFNKAAFGRPEKVCNDALTVLSRSSMVSRFEKPRFRDFINSLNSHEKQSFADALYQRIHGKKQLGFELMLGMLQQHKLAKWSVISVVPFYYAPSREVFVKPTTAKGILAYLEIDSFQYHPTPSWDFYKRYQTLVKDVRNEVVPTLSDNNAAITGFLMSAM
ncbi:hypothetical protein BST95_14265 [Halioglobus japonicus]|uniref:Uncharacterized protein n=1 Tax=Halioglobus japonicus TaxID=930805 RepID=A0AAP8MH08_9GAMM|nr:hypothetical protein [Halioglobus japonicus]AQA19233.1 hypothetical protein BST95_14265 [Halioglobus japonicus]PLW87730.1 hypothetical protein C0029_03920 [Halioglobus japonicus]GHD06896.1 hypothetical protein GCM10007052_02090 [Halioglobus japonicus]